MSSTPTVVSAYQLLAVHDRPQGYTRKEFLALDPSRRGALMAAWERMQMNCLIHPVSSRRCPIDNIMKKAYRLASVIPPLHHSTSTDKGVIPSMRTITITIADVGPDTVSVKTSTLPPAIGRSLSAAESLALTLITQARHLGHEILYCAAPSDSPIKEA